jgi:hypothetical protein
MRPLALALLLAACGSKAAEPTTPPTTTPEAPAPVPPASNEQRVTARMKEMAEICESGTLEPMIPLIVYRGEEDLAGKWKRPMKPDDEYALIRVKEACEIIPPPAQMLFGAYKEESESEGTWMIIEVSTAQGNAGNFAFLQLGDDLVLGDID